MSEDQLRAQLIRMGEWYEARDNIDATNPVELALVELLEETAEEMSR